MSRINSLAYRKQRLLTKADIPEGTISIGDAAYSLCPMLKQVTIPASVEYIGVAAFCSSGLEDVTFLGVPDCIEQSAFAHCFQLKQVLVPNGTKEIFEEKLPSIKHLIREGSLKSTSNTDLFGNPIVKRCRLTYNQRDFSWAVGDGLKLSELFSGPTALIGNPSYQFRRKCLFVFMKSETASTIVHSHEFFVPANTFHFNRKFKEKYGTKEVRIFLFVCDDGENATFYDEVRFLCLGKNSITVTSTFLA